MTLPRRSTAYQTIARWALGFALAIYATAVFTWQHQHLNAQSANDIATLLSNTKHAFLGDSQDENANKSNVVGNTVLSHRPAHLILQNPKLPDWVKQYASWHKKQRKRYLDAKRSNSTSADDVKFLISRCLKNDKCGGASDRLQDMPYNIMLANRTNRVLLVRWEKPAMLEKFLVPPAYHGIDWTVPDDMNEMLNRDGDWNLRGKETNEKLKIVSVIRRDSAAPIFRKYENEEVGHKM